MESPEKHHDKWVHRCPYYSCSFYSFRRPDFRAHVSSHSANDLKIRKCGFLNCNQVFLSVVDYNSHQRSKHGVLIREEVLA